MNELSKGITPKTFYVKLKDGRQINISTQQKANISLAITDKLQFIEIFDCDTDELLYAGKTNNIEEIIERKFTNTGYMVICGYGNKHQLIEGKIDCNCKNKYGFSEMDLKMWARENNKSMYMQELTIEDKRQCYIDLKKQGKIL